MSLNDRHHSREPMQSQGAQRQQGVVEKPVESLARRVSEGFLRQPECYEQIGSSKERVNRRNRLTPSKITGHDEAITSYTEHSHNPSLTRRASECACGRPSLNDRHQSVFTSASKTRTWAQLFLFSSMNAR